MAKFVIYGRPGCEWCEKAISFLVARGRAIEYINVRGGEDKMAAFRKEFPNATTVPQIIYDNPPFEKVIIGGYTDLVHWWALLHDGKLSEGSDI